MQVSVVSLNPLTIIVRLVAFLRVQEPSLKQRAFLTVISNFVSEGKCLVVGAVLAAESVHAGVFET